MKKIIFILTLLISQLVISQKIALDVAKFDPMTTIEMNALSSPQQGWEVFNTTTQSKWFHNGTIWVDRGAGGGGSDGVVSDVTVNGNNLDFTGSGGAENGSIDISAITAVAANTAKGDYSAAAAAEVAANTLKAGITPAEQAEIAANTLKVGITGTQITKLSNIPNDQGAVNTDFETRVALNDAKITNTDNQTGAEVDLTGYVKPAATSAVIAADDVNTAIGKLEKGLEDAISGGVSSINGATGIVVLDTDDIAEAANLYYTEARVSANTDVVANTAKAGITTAQANEITANNAKVGITAAQITAISTNATDITTLEGEQTTQDAAIALNTAKLTYPAADAAKVANIPADQSAINTDIETRTALNDAKTNTNDFPTAAVLTGDNLTLTVPNQTDVVVNLSPLTAITKDYSFINLDAQTITVDANSRPVVVVSGGDYNTLIPNDLPLYLPIELYIDPELPFTSSTFTIADPATTITIEGSTTYKPSDNVSTFEVERGRTAILERTGSNAIKVTYVSESTSGGGTAAATTYDNTASGSAATDVKGALDDLYTSISTSIPFVDYLVYNPVAGTTRAMALKDDLTSIENTDALVVFNHMKTETAGRTNPSLYVVEELGTYLFSDEFVWDRDISGGFGDTRFYLFGLRGSNNNKGSAGNGTFKIENGASVYFKGFDMYNAVGAGYSIYSTSAGATEQGCIRCVFDDVNILNEGDAIKIVNPFYNNFRNNVVKSRQGIALELRNESGTTAYGNSTSLNNWYRQGTGIEDSALKITSSTPTGQRITLSSFVNDHFQSFNQAADNNSTAIKLEAATNLNFTGSYAEDALYALYMDNTRGINLDNVYLYSKSSTTSTGVVIDATANSKGFTIEDGRIDVTSTEIPLQIADAGAWLATNKVHMTINNSADLSLISIGANRRHDIRIEKDGSANFANAANPTETAPYGKYVSITKDLFPFDPTGTTSTSTNIPDALVDALDNTNSLLKDGSRNLEGTLIPNSANIIKLGSPTNDFNRIYTRRTAYAGATDFWIESASNPVGNKFGWAYVADPEAGYSLQYTLDSSGTPQSVNDLATKGYVDANSGGGSSAALLPTITKEAYDLNPSAYATGQRFLTIPESTATATVVSKEISTSSYTLLPEDSGKTLLFTNASGVIVTEASSPDDGFNVRLKPFTTGKVQLDFLTNGVNGVSDYYENDNGDFVLEYFNSSLGWASTGSISPYSVVQQLYIQSNAISATNDNNTLPTVSTSNCSVVVQAGNGDAIQGDWLLRAEITTADGSDAYFEIRASELNNPQVGDTYTVTYTARTNRAASDAHSGQEWYGISGESRDDFTETFSEYTQNITIDQVASDNPKFRFFLHNGTGTPVAGDRIFIGRFNAVKTN